MIPHPTTWQNANERKQQELIAAVHRLRRESMAMSGGARRANATVRTRPARELPALMLRAALIRLRPFRRPQAAARLVPKRI